MLAAVTTVTTIGTIEKVTRIGTVRGESKMLSVPTRPPASHLAFTSELMITRPTSTQMTPRNPTPPATPRPAAQPREPPREPQPLPVHRADRPSGGRAGIQSAPVHHHMPSFEKPLCSLIG